MSTRRQNSVKESIIGVVGVISAAVVGALIAGVFMIRNTYLEKSLPDPPTPTPKTSNLDFREATEDGDSYNPSSLPCVYAFQDLGEPPEKKTLLWYYTHYHRSVHPNENDKLIIDNRAPIEAKRVNGFPSFIIQNHNPFKIYITSIKVGVRSTPLSQLSVPDLKLVLLNGCNSLSNKSNHGAIVKLPDRPSLFPVILGEDYPITLNSSDNATGNLFKFSITFNSDSYFGDYEIYFLISWKDDFAREVSDKEYGGYFLKRLRATIEELNNMDLEEEY